MKKMKTLSITVGDIMCFKALKRGGATIRGNTVLVHVIKMIQDSNVAYILGAYLQ